MLIFTQLAVFAEPSEWATEFIENASKDELIPESLKSDYQNNIKRFEYVLLALQVLEQNDVEVEIKETNPFVDISGHLYETEIVKAYIAGIVGGYDDKTFRPDNEIKREEVAALVYNLIKTINPTSELPIQKSIFSDTSSISTWALPFVEYNYRNEIMSGTGKVDGLDTINPQGQTSREEAITLLYKVSKNEELLAKMGMTSVISGENEYSVSEMNILASNVGKDTLKDLLELSDTLGTEITSISPYYIEFTFDDGSVISYRSDDWFTDLNVYLSDLKYNQEIVDAYEQFNLITVKNSKLKSTAKKALEELEIDNKIYFGSTNLGIGTYQYYSFIRGESGMVLAFTYSEKN